jgi:hypothetical protein
MPLFGRHRHTSPAGPGQTRRSGAAGTIMPPGWQPVGGRPFDGHLDDAAHEITRIMYGVPRSIPRPGGIGHTTFTDVFRTSIDGRAVTVANAWTVIEPGLFQAGRGTPSVAVCAVELPSVLPVTLIQPRRFPRITSLGETRTGDPVFDDHYQVIGMPRPLAAVTGLSTADAVLTPEVRQRIMAHDDWVFQAESYLLGCVTKGAFRSAEQITTRVGEVLGVVAAIPTSVLPDHVDHSADDLVARFSKIDNIEDAIATLQQLTPQEREQLARSDTPLAAFADVQTPQEAIALFESLDPQRRMQIIAMFMRVQDR